MKLIKNNDLYYTYRNRYILKLNIKANQVKYAQDTADFRTNNSITNNECNVYGNLGEIVFCDFFNISKDDIHKNKNYDVMFLGEKIDIKSKRTTVTPKSSYNFSVSSYSLHQECDAYIGMRIVDDMSAAFLLGYISKERFMTKGIFGKKGSVEAGSENNFTYKADSMNIPIADMDVLDVDVFRYVEYQYGFKDENDMYATSEWFDVDGKVYRIIFNKITNRLTLQDDKKINKYDAVCSDAYDLQYILNKLII